MWSDLFHALLRGPDQLRYFRHTHSPFSPWRRQTDRVVEATAQEAARYGIHAPVDRRRAYQLARLVVPDRHGNHLVDVVPDAYLAFSPPSAATFHAGRRSYASPSARRDALLRHPQTLAFLLTPPALARLGAGNSTAGGLAVLAGGEGGVSTDAIAARLAESMAGKAAPSDLRAYAEIVARLSAGVPAAGEPSGETDKAA